MVTPVARSAAMVAKMLAHDQRRQAEAGLVEHQQRAACPSARGRPPASAARRPTACRRAARAAPAGAGTACRRSFSVVAAVACAEAHLAVGAEQQVVLDRHASRTARASPAPAPCRASRAPRAQRRPIGSPSKSIVPRARQHAHQGVEQRRLAGAVGADHGDRRWPASARERQAVQHLGAAVAGVQVVDVEQESAASCQCSVPR